MANYFIPPDEDKSAYGITHDGGFSHPWKLTVVMGEEGKVGLWGGYDRNVPLQLSSNTPGIIEFREPRPSPPNDRIITVLGKRQGFTILDARGTVGPPWCSLQIEVVPRLHTPNIPEWKFYRMAAEYYTYVATGDMPEREYRQKWALTEAEYNTFVGLFARSSYNRQYWANLNDNSPRISVATRDFLVMGVGGITTMDSNYGNLVLGLRIQSLQARSGIGSIAGAVARIFTSDPDIIGVIESSGDLIEIGLGGFAVARDNGKLAMRPKIYPTRTIKQRRIVGNLFRDHVFDHVTEMHRGTEYTVEKEVRFETDIGERYADVVLRDSKGKIVAAFECKTGLGESIPLQVRKDRQLYLDKDIRTIKVTNDFFFVP